MGKKKKTDVGRIVHTRDEYFLGNEHYRKPGYEGRGNYRKAVVIADQEEQRALVKLTTSKKGIRLKNVPKSKFKPYVETKDDEGKPITYGKKFRPDKTSKNLSPQDIAIIAKACFEGTDEERTVRNRNKVRGLKGRPPKK